MSNEKLSTLAHSLALLPRHATNMSVSPLAPFSVFAFVCVFLSIARSLHPTHRHNTVVAATRSHAVVSSSLDPVPY